MALIGAPNFNMTRPRRRRMDAVLLFTYWGGLLLATHLPPSGIELPGAQSDKVIHTLAYALLALLLCKFAAAGEPLGRTKTIAVFLILAGYGVLDELSQRVASGRTPDVRDWLADLIGLALGIAVFLVCVERFGNRSVANSSALEVDTAGDRSSETSRS